MGIVVRFPGETKLALRAHTDAQTELGVIIILPVIRIERIPDPADDVESPRTAPGRKRRRRAAAP